MDAQVLAGKRSRQRRGLCAMVSAVAIASIVGGCAAATPTTVVAGGATATSTAEPTASATASPTASAASKAAAAKQRIAGSVGPTNLPAAAAVGSGFRAHAEDSDDEQPADANGAGADERSPRDVADGLVPFGCPGVEAGTIPLPTRAFQQTYRATDGRQAVALVLEYPSAGDATTLLTTMAGMLAKCAQPSSLRGLVGPRTVAEVRSASSDLVQDSRHEVGPDAATQVWDETIVRQVNRVSLVAVERGDGATRPAQRSVVDGLRAGLAK